MTTFVTGSGGDLYDALAFNASGSILYATDRYNYPSIHIVGFDRSGKSVLDVVDPYQGEGLAVAKIGVLFVNNNGTERRLPRHLRLGLDARTERHHPDDGRERRHPRGFATVDCKGYMLVDQSGTIVKLSPALFPPNAGAGSCSSSVKHA